MGLIKAAIGSLGGTLADQWKEFFYCDSLDSDVLMTKGSKRISSRSSNTKASDNIITSGSGIAVADGQCMMIVEQGKIVEFCAEPGEFIFNSSTEPSIFSGSLGTSVVESFKTMAKRFTYGGDTGKDQRVYYFNTKEITDNKFGTANPIPFRVLDRNIGLDIDVSVRCNGLYSYKIADPILFYKNVCANVSDSFTRSAIESQLKTEFISALQPAFAKISGLGVRPSALPGYAAELADAMNTELTEKWSKLRGLAVVSVALNPITLSDEDAELIKNAQHAAILRDPTMAAATLAGAQAEAMKSAAKNENGAMTAFMGMNMAGQAGGLNAGQLYAMGEKKTAEKPDEAQWTCKCGTVNTGNFCGQCGEKKPESGWVCKCGTTNKGKFCTNCGSKKPASEPLYRCDKCGWEPEDPKNPPKFCPECGDRFDDGDIR